MQITKCVNVLNARGTVYTSFGVESDIIMNHDKVLKMDIANVQKGNKVGIKGLLRVLTIMGVK